MKFEVKNRYTGEVKFTAVIKCEKDEKISIKLKLAVEWAIENNANLSSANLRYADLRYADLRYADLRSANLSYADLRSANLSYADLRSANLRSANLRSANLSYADLRYADLRSANLSYAVGDKVFLKTMQLEKYNISYTYDRLFIGCENHTIEEWFNFTDKEIIAMDGKEALVWWKKWKPIMENIIKVSPAKGEQ